MTNEQPCPPDVLKPARLDEIEARRRQARTLVSRLCEKPERWTMSIPPQQDDSDMLLIAALDDTKALLLSHVELSDQLQAAQARVAKLEAAAGEVLAELHRMPECDCGGLVAHGQLGIAWAVLREALAEAEAGVEGGLEVREE